MWQYSSTCCSHEETLHYHIAKAIFQPGPAQTGSFRDANSSQEGSGSNGMPAYRASSEGYTRMARPKFDKSRVNGMVGIHSMVKLQTIKRLLTSKGLVPVRRLCYRCGWKVKKGDYERRSGDYGYCCTNTSCRIRITRFHGHPLFQLSRYGLELSQQAAMVSLIIHATSLVNTHVQLGISYGAIESMALRLRQRIQKWVGALGCQ